MFPCLKTAHLAPTQSFVSLASISILKSSASLGFGANRIHLLPWLSLVRLTMSKSVGSSFVSSMILTQSWGWKSFHERLNFTSMYGSVSLKKIERHNCVTGKAPISNKFDKNERFMTIVSMTILISSNVTWSMILKCGSRKKDREFAKYSNSYREWLRCYWAKIQIKLVRNDQK